MRTGCNNPRYGVEVSDETRKLLSEKKLEAYKDGTLAKRISETLKNKRETLHLWRGGVSTENMLIRRSYEYKQWRTSVFKRDGYKCTICGSTKDRLNADHIKPFSTHKDLRFSIGNGRTLCIPCHRKTDTYGTKALLFTDGE